MIIVDLGLPPTPPLSINRERALHWAARCRQLDPWRDLAWATAINAGLRPLLGQAPAVVTVHLPVPDRRRRDPHNYIPTVKAIIDGLVNAHVWPDDDPRYLSVNEPVLWQQPHAEIRIELRATG